MQSQNINNGSKGDIGLKPEPFDETRFKTKRFLNQLDNYFYLNQKKYPTDEIKIRAAITYFKEKEAEEWAINYYNSYFNDASILGQTWVQFKEEVLKAFSTGQDFATIKALRQGSDSVEEYVTLFKDIVKRAKITDKIIKIDYFKKGINDKLREKILNLPKTPTTLEDWQKKAIQFDNIWRQERINKQGDKATISLKKYLQMIKEGQMIIPKTERKDPNAMDVDAIQTKNTKTNN